MNWHKEYDTDCLPTQSVSSNEMISINRLSAWIKKIPVTRTNDFLWEY
jgi:hypothetical protein